jgi:hypothetical protein
MDQVFVLIFFYSSFQARAYQNFKINCQLNDFLQHEYALGLEYLNAVIKF